MDNLLRNNRSQFNGLRKLSSVGVGILAATLLSWEAFSGQPLSPSSARCVLSQTLLNASRSDSGEANPIGALEHCEEQMGQDQKKAHLEYQMNKGRESYFKTLEELSKGKSPASTLYLPLFQSEVKKGKRQPVLSQDPAKRRRDILSALGDVRKKFLKKQRQWDVKRAKLKAKDSPKDNRPLKDQLKEIDRLVSGPSVSPARKISERGMVEPPRGTADQRWSKKKLPPMKTPGWEKSLDPNGLPVGAGTK